MGFTPPDALWIALWDGVATLNDGYLSWPLDERSKQYLGNINQTVGGITLNIDATLRGGVRGELRLALRGAVIVLAGTAAALLRKSTNGKNTQ